MNKNIHLDHVKYIVKFYEEHGRIPKNLEYKPITHIKERYWRGKLDREAIDYINNSIMPIGVLDKQILKTHLDHVKYIVKFYEEHDRIPSRIEYPIISHIKTLYRNSELDKDAIDYINNSPMPSEVLDKQILKTHLDHVKYIVKFYEEHDRIPSGTEYTHVHRIKQTYRSGKLDQETIDFINNSIMPIELLDAQHTQPHLDHVKYIVKFYEEKDRTPYYAEYKFINTIKQLYRKCKLDQEAIDFINNSSMPIELLDVIRKPKQTQLHHVKRIVKFYEKHNRIPMNSEDYMISKIKQYYTGGELEQDAINYINKSNMPIEILEKRHLWGKRHFDELKRIYKELLELNDTSAIIHLQEQVNEIYEIKLEELLNDISDSTIRTD